jgi:hypothetical protein
MKEIATIQFEDAAEHCDAVAIVRANATHVAVCLSLASNGDTEVVMPRATARQLVAALEKAAPGGRR